MAGHGLGFRFQTQWLYSATQNMFTLHRLTSLSRLRSQIAAVPIGGGGADIRPQIRIRVCVRQYKGVPTRSVIFKHHY